MNGVTETIKLNAIKQNKTNYWNSRVHQPERKCDNDLSSLPSAEDQMQTKTETATY